jgi:uncharacterized protein (TIGR02453 family)
MGTNRTGFSDRTFRWLADLEENNSGEWFTQHRDVFTEHVEEPFVQLLEDVTGRLESSAVPLRGGAATTFRLARDVRFSADKTPYNTHRSGVLTPTGTKAESGGLVYVRLTADGGFLAGGLYRPQTAQLDPLRQAIVDDPDRWAAVVADLAAAGHSLDRSEAVKTMPRGYAHHVDHVHADDLRLKQLVVMQDMPRAAWLDDAVADHVAGFAQAVAPLLTFVRSVRA